MGGAVKAVTQPFADLVKDTGGNLGNLVKDTGGSIGNVIGGPVGNLISDTTGNVGNLVKDTTSSPLGQAALLGGAAYLAAPYILGSGTAAAGSGTAASTGTAVGTAAGTGATAGGTGLTLGGSGLGLTTGGSGLGLTAGSAGASTIGAGIGTNLAALQTGAGLLGASSAIPAATTTAGTTAVTTAPSLGTGLTTGSSGLGLNTGGGLGITSGSAGASTIGAGIGSELAALGTGTAALGAGSALSNPATIGAMTPANYSLTGAAPMASVFDTLAGYGSSALDFAKANPQLTGSLLGSLTGALSAANAPKSQTATTSIDPQIKAEYLANLERAKTTAAGLQARQFEGFTPDYLQAEQQIRNLGLGGKGQQTIDETTRRAMIEAGFTPQQIQAATSGNTALANAQGYTAQQMAAAQANRGNVANVSGLDGSRFMSAYQNPFEEQVVQGALGDIERSRQMQEQANMAQATAAKAFGGSRQGIVSGLTNEAALRQAATTSGQLRSAGFTQAAQLGQNDAARQLQAQLANQGIDVTLEQANTQLRQQGILSNQAASNQAAQFGAGATNQANLINAAALNQTGQFNAQMAQQAALANQNAYAQGAGVRQSAIGQLGQLGSLQQNLGFTGSNAVMEAQARQQALNQSRLDAARNLELERLGITSGALGLQPANTGGTQTTPLYSSTLGSALGGALSGAYIGSLLQPKA